MVTKVTDIRSNLNENILHAVSIIGRSRDRRRVFEAIYQGKKEIKKVSDIIESTGLSRMRVLQEAQRLYANHIVEKTKKDRETAYKKDETYTHHKKKILSIIDDPSKTSKIPTKQKPHTSTSTYHIQVRGTKPRVVEVTADDIDSFQDIQKIQGIKKSIKVGTLLESKIKAGLQKIIGENHSFTDWGGEKNDLYTNKLRYRGKRRRAAFAIKGRATKGPLMPKKMGKNGDQISRLFGSSAEMFFVVYHGKIDESITSQLEAFALGRALSGKTIYYCTIDGDDLNRLLQAYPLSF